MTSTDLAPVAPQPVAKPRKPAKAPRISPTLKEAINLLATGECKTQKAAAARVGVSDAYLCTQLKKPHIQAFLAQQAAGNISRGVLRASARYVQLIDAESEHVAARVSERFLEHGGIIKPQQPGGVNVSINNSIAAGYVVDLTPTIDASVNPQSTQDGRNASLINGAVTEECGDRGE